jgi:hypothetical protein
MGELQPATGTLHLCWWCRTPIPIEAPGCFACGASVQAFTPQIWESTDRLATQRVLHRRWLPRSRQEQLVGVWLDGQRPPPEEAWVCVRTPAEAIALLETGTVNELSLGHDQGLVDVLAWLEERAAREGLRPPRLSLRSGSPMAHERMQRAVESIRRHADGT